MPDSSSQDHDQHLKSLLKEFFEQFFQCFFPDWAARFDLTELVALFHVEIESRDSVHQFRPRMFEYYTQLRRDSGLPVLPIGLYLRVGLEVTGWDAYEEYFWEHCLLRFQYAYVGLPS